LIDMKKYFIAIFLMLWVSLATVKPALSAAPPPMAVPPLLAISEIKITGDEFVVLKNNSGKDIPDLSVYWLDGYNSNQPLAAGVTNTSQQLPAVKLASGQAVLMSSNGMATCGAAVTAKLSVGLTDGGGFLQLIQTTQTALGVTKLPVDFVSWSSGADNLIPNVPSSTKDPKAAYYRYATANGYGWQLADVDGTNPCQLNVASATSSLNTGLTVAAGAVPSVAGVSTADATISLPAVDIGLAAPQISEVLPNPAPPQTDADDEFIELYNSNDKDFDLSGFVLQSGTTSLHKYTFPDGTIIGAKKFVAFFSGDTNLSLSNSEGQVALLDPSGDMLSQTDVYGAAKDGYSWVFADGLWQWTTTPTPNAINVISAPATKSVKAATTGTTKKPSSSKIAAASPSSSNFPSGGTPAPSLHPAILAGIGSLAVVYALYEYRNDLANYLYKLRRYREARRVAG
jgi:hypothetical protein